MKERMDSTQKYRILFHAQQYCHLPEAAKTQENLNAWIDSLPEEEGEKIRHFEIFLNVEMEMSYRRFILEAKGICMDAYMKKYLSEADYAVWNEAIWSEPGKYSRPLSKNEDAISTKGAKQPETPNSFKNADLLLQKIKQMCVTVLKIAEGKYQCLGSGGFDLMWRLFLTEYSLCIEKILALNYYLQDVKYPELGPKKFGIHFETLDFNFFLRRFNELSIRIGQLKSTVKDICDDMNLEAEHPFIIWGQQITTIGNTFKKKKLTLEGYL